MVDVQPHVNEFNTGPSYLFDNLVDYLTSNTRQIIVNKEGDNRSFFVSSNTDWALTSDVDWISIDTATQSGDALVEFSVAANGETADRSGGVTVSNGVQSVSVRIFQDAGPVSVLDQAISKLLLYPNPTGDEIRIKNLPAEIRQFRIELTDLTGRVILEKQGQVSDRELLIDVSQVTPGVYLLNLAAPYGTSANYTTLTRKVVIN